MFQLSSLFRVRCFSFGIKLLIILCLTLGALQSRAQNTTSQAAKEHEQRLLQEQQRLQEKMRVDKPAADVFLQQEQKKKLEDLVSDDTCIDISLISVQGVNALDISLVDDITKKYLHQCLNLGKINLLIKEISSLYLDRGYITSRAFVQPQRLKQGTLDVLVIEGKLEKIQALTSNLTDKQLRWAFPAEEGKILNLRDLEQGIEQLNRLQQNSATLEIKPGTETGDSQVEIGNHRSSSLHSSFSLDNSGSEATGKTLLGGSISWDNPLGVNDSVYLNLSNAIGGDNGAKSRSYTLMYSVPYKYTLLNISASHFDYQQLIQGATTTFMSSGESGNQSIGIDYTLARGQFSKWLISTNFTRKESKNYLEDVFLESSSRVLYIADTGINYTYKLDQGIIHSSLKYYKSLDVLDAKTKLAKAEQAYQFSKYVVDIGISKYFDVKGFPLKYQSSFEYLYSPDDLIASEGVSIGGRYTVRGIDGEGISGNQGGYIRNEISTSKAIFQTSQIEPFIGVDYGQVSSPTPTPTKENLAGVAIGVRYSVWQISASLTYSKNIKKPENFSGDDNAVYFEARVSF